MADKQHLRSLDGWRGVSILLVLAAHLLPLGPKNWGLNVATGVMGMVIFFVLSGFLITTILLTEVPVGAFLTRRFCRVIPLAWLFLIMAMLTMDKLPTSWLSHFLFYANLPPQDLVPVTAHMWSLCVEMQFYVGVAILYAAFGVRGLWALPVLCLGVTALRQWNGAYASSVTYFRIDELLAGCVLALAWHGRMGARIPKLLASIPQWPMVLLLLVSCANIGAIQLFRPYFAAILVGTTIANPSTRLVEWLSIRPLVFLAGISYALYVIHPILGESWLGSGGQLEKYSKRPLLFVVLFALAYLSTHFYERRWIALGRRLSDSFKPVPR